MLIFKKISGILFFIAKVERLAASRLRVLCEALSLTQSMIDQVRACLRPSLLACFFVATVARARAHTHLICLCLFVQIWTVSRFVIRSMRSLLKNRHLDQILLCAIFSVCRVAGVFPRVTFAEVVEVYRTGQLSASRQRWTSAAMGFSSAARTVRAVATPEATAYAAHCAKDHAVTSGSSSRDVKLVASKNGDILHFYNLVFVPAIEVRFVCV